MTINKTVGLINNEFNMQEATRYFQDNSYEAKYKRVRNFVSELFKERLLSSTKMSKVKRRPKITKAWVKKFVSLIRGK